MRRRAGLCAAALCWVAAVAPGCGDAPPAGGPAPSETGERRGPDTANWALHDSLVESRAFEHHASDGGGRAWLESVEPAEPRAGETARFALVFEAGPLGVASGGAIFFQVSPFWGWSTPQVQDPGAPGFTEVTGPEGSTLEAKTLDQQLLGIRVAGRALEAGERVELVYGGGLVGARVDRYAEREARLWFAVDGDGDGVWGLLADSPGVRVRAGPPARLRLALPSVLRPGEEFTLRVAVLDASGSAGVEFAGAVELTGAAPVLELPSRVELAPGQEGIAEVRGVARGAGVVRVGASGPDGLETRSAPVEVSERAPRVLWADLHGHSGLSDGTGTPEDYFAYARDVAGLDVAALTDHDHWGMQPLESAPGSWERIVATTQRFHQPGHFVTLLGFEWTSWIHGHRHVLYFTDRGPLLSSLSPETDSPRELWDALEGETALTFAHHSAGGPIAIDWSIAPDPRFEPVTEIVSVHGSSEAPDSPVPIYDPVPGHWVRDTLARGYRLGFIGSGDSHDGHPGLAQLAAPSGGLAALLTEERTREGVLAALRARRCYATNGARMLLRVALGAVPMGGELSVPREGADAALTVQVIAESGLDRVELVRSGQLVDGAALEGLETATLHRQLRGLRPGESVYVRAVQEDGGAAWSSPIFVSELVD